jgi:hypothetical protein
MAWLAPTIAIRAKGMVLAESIADLEDKQRENELERQREQRAEAAKKRKEAEAKQRKAAEEKQREATDGNLDVNQNLSIVEEQEEEEEEVGVQLESSSSPTHQSIDRVVPEGEINSERVVQDGDINSNSDREGMSYNDETNMEEEDINSGSDREGMLDKDERNMEEEGTYFVVPRRALIVDRQYSRTMGCPICSQVRLHTAYMPSTKSVVVNSRSALRSSSYLSTS